MGLHKHTFLHSERDSMTKRYSTEWEKIFAF